MIPDKEILSSKYQTTFAALSKEKPLSPIVGMGMVSMQQAAEFLDTSTKEVQALRQRLRKDMDALGMVIVTAREIVGGIPGAVRHSDGSYDLPLEDGSMTHVTGGKYTYFSAAAVKRLAEELKNAAEYHSILSKTQANCGATNTPVLRELSVSVFDNPEFGSIRTILENGKVLFCGNDVATALGYKVPKDAIATHCKGAVIRRLPTNGGKQDVKFIPEGDLYRLAAKSELPGAERFESWVFDKVLPSIRKTGGYIAGQETMSDVELLAKAVLVAQKTIEERNAQIAELKIKNEINRPKVAFAEAVEQSNKSITVGAFAKILYDQDGIAMGRNTMFKWLRDQKLLDANNYPYQRYMNAGYFEVAEIIRKGQILKVPFITGKGQIYLARKLMDGAHVSQ